MQCAGITSTPFDPALGVTAEVVESLFEKQVLVMPGAPGLIDGVAGDHIAISPPFTITADQVQEVVDAVIASVEEVAASLDTITYEVLVSLGARVPRRH